MRRQTEMEEYYTPDTFNSLHECATARVVHSIGMEFEIGSILKLNNDIYTLYREFFQ